MRTLTAIVFGAVLAVTPASAQTPAAMQALAARVETLEAQEAIRQLWADYGRTLDARDFAAFSTLWAREATYGGTPAAPGAKGPAAIGAFLEKALGTTYPDSKGTSISTSRSTSRATARPG